MPSTFSSLKIELIATGEQSGTWGVTTNTNLGTAIEEAITGSADVTFTNGNDTTITLTDTNAAQTARNLRLNLIGSSTGAQNLILGSGCQIEKLYLINNTLGHTITVKNTTGTGVAVPAGKSMFVYNNGTNVVDAITYLSSIGTGVFDAGTVSAPSITFTGDTNTGIYSPAADTIGFTEGGVEAARFTSTGALQLNNNLTFSGTGNRIIGDFSNATIANRVAFQTSTTNTGSNLNLLPNGTATGAFWNAFGNSDPTNAALGRFGITGGNEVTIRSDITGTGTYAPLTIYTGGSERLRIDGTTGFIGIGTVSPTTPLNVVGSANVISSTVNTTDVRAFYANSSTVGGEAGYSSGANNSEYGRLTTIPDTLSSGFAGSWKISLRGSGGGMNERVRITSAGLVLIGTTTNSTGAKVQIGTGTISVNPNTDIFGLFGGDVAGSASPTTYFGISYDTTNNIANFEALSGGVAWRNIGLATRGGSVGIGTSSPNATLHLGAGGASIRIGISASNQYGELYRDGATGNIVLNAAQASFGNLVFQTQSTERMRIDNGGNVTIRANGFLSQAFTYNENGGEIQLYDETGTVATLLDQSNNQTRLLELINGSNMVVGTGAANTTGLVQFVTQNAERMRIDSSGNVGIGTSSPAAKLHVAGAINASVRVTGTASTDYTFFNAINPSGVEFQAVANGNDSVRLLAVTNHPMSFFTNNTERMRITSAGNVGIGTSSPARRLDVIEDVQYQLRVGTAASNSYDIGRSPTDGLFYFYGNQSGANGYVFSGANGERMRIDSSGNVCVGTATALYTAANRGNITLNGSTSSIFGLAYGGTAGGYIYCDSGQIQLWCEGSRTLSMGTASAGVMTFLTNNSERMRITTGGDLLVGSTTDADQRVRVTCNGVTPQWGIKVHNTATTGNNQFIEFGTEAGFTARGSITYNRAGGTVSYNTTSDYRLKENIVDLPNALQTVSKLKPRQFDWKETGNTTTGFIAHELAEVLPHAVTGEKDAVDKDGSPKYQGIDTSFLVATLTAAIQEQQAMIEELKQEVAKLKGV